VNIGIEDYNKLQSDEDSRICHLLASIINQHLSEEESKIWHRHPTWFLEGNPIAGYSKLIGGIRLMFWSGASFDEENLKINTGKFKDAAITYTSVEEVVVSDVERWLQKSIAIQWDYKNIVKRKGTLERLK
jgi:hypothetical protein